VHFTFPVIQDHFCEIISAPLRCDGPKHIRQIFEPKFICRLHAVQLRIDFQAPSLAFHFCLACGLRHELCAPEIDFGRPTAVPVIHCLCSARDYIGSKHWCLFHRFDLVLLSDTDNDTIEDRKKENRNEQSQFVAHSVTS